jgi:hypothetical protein
MRRRTGENRHESPASHPIPSVRRWHGCESACGPLSPPLSASVGAPCGVGTLSSCRARAMLSARPPLAKRP